MIVLCFAGREEPCRVAAGARLQDPRQAVHPHRAAGAGGALQEGALARKRPRPQVLSEAQYLRPPRTIMSSARFSYRI